MTEPIPYRLIRSDRKTMCLEITPAGEVRVRCSRRLSRQAVEDFVESKRSWIEARQKLLAALPVQPPLEDDALAALTRQAEADLSERAARIAAGMGVSYRKINVRPTRSQWGSCSDKGSLSFNSLLALTPEAVREYVVVHELCHLRQMNHSDAFWAEVERVMPGYREPLQWLKAHGPALLCRLPDLV